MTMRKKSFGAGIAATTAWFVLAISGGGCSSDPAAAEPEDAAVDSKKIAPAADAGGPEDAGACPRTAPTVADLDATGWNPPPAIQHVCSASDIAAFEGNFKGASKYSDLVKGLPAACSSCIMNKQTDATWSFVVTDASGDKGFLNYGACYAAAAGGSNACGKAVQYSEFCISISCRTCPSSAETSACRKDAVTQAACHANVDVGAGCGTDQAALKALDTACGKASAVVSVLCGGDADGGSDAAADGD